MLAGIWSGVFSQHETPSPGNALVVDVVYQGHSPRPLSEYAGWGRVARVIPSPVGDHPGKPPPRRV